MNRLKKISPSIEKCRAFFRKYKTTCPIELTARCNNHFGIKKSKRSGEIAGINMHGNFSITLLEFLLLGAFTVFVISAAAMIEKTVFKFKYKRRYQK